MNKRKWDEKCLICDSGMEYFFSKGYTKELWKPFMEDIGKADFYKCAHCGFVFSKTHHELSSKRFEKLNFDFHHCIEGFSDRNKGVGFMRYGITKDGLTEDGFLRQPDYLQHAAGIAILVRNHIIKNTSRGGGGGYRLRRRLRHDEQRAAKVF